MQFPGFPSERLITVLTAMHSPLRSCLLKTEFGSVETTGVAAGWGCDREEGRIEHYMLWIVSSSLP